MIYRAFMLSTQSTVNVISGRSTVTSLVRWGAACYFVFVFCLKPPSFSCLFFSGKSILGKRAVMILQLKEWIMQTYQLCLHKQYLKTGPTWKAPCTARWLLSPAIGHPSLCVSSTCWPGVIVCSRSVKAGWNRKYLEENGLHTLPC